MLAPSRRNKILQLLRENKQITVKDTAQHLQISLGTLRNDLKILEKEGFLTRTHGGAVLPEQHEVQYSFKWRAEINSDEKKAIGQVAGQLLENSKANCIMIDASSTGLELAKYLLELKDLTVITNGLATAQLLAQNSKLTVIMVGGIVRSGSTEVEGLLGHSLLKNIHADYFFFSSHGLTLEQGFTEFSLYEAELKKEMAANAEQVIALSDHTKIGRKSMVTSIQLRDVDQLITSQKASESLLKRIEADFGTKIIVLQQGE